jgi:hypothetical protein
MESKSQAGQDLFVYAVTQTLQGTFLEIGGCDPEVINNTYELERLGWSGYSFDIDPNLSYPFFTKRKNCQFIVADVTKFDWNRFIQENNLLNKTIDYLSFDVDDASLPTLRRFPFDKLKFNVMTVEHDRYRFGQAVADEMRNIIQPHGYELICRDIQDQGLPYEDWYVHKDFLQAHPHVEQFRANNVNWREVIQRL